MLPEDLDYLKLVIEAKNKRIQELEAALISVKPGEYGYIKNAIETRTIIEAVLGAK